MTSPDPLAAAVTAAQAAQTYAVAQISTLQQQNAALTAQHQADQQTIAALEAQLAGQPKTAPGVNVPSGQLPARDKALSGVAALRWYWPQKPQGVKTPMRLPGAAELGADPGRRQLIVSFKTWPQDILAGLYDADIVATAQACPTDRPTLLIPWHEPEDDIERGEFTVQQYRDAVTHFAQLVHGAGNPMVRVAVCLMDFTFLGGKGRDWHNYFVPGAVDVLCVDAYQWSPTNPADHSQVFVPAAQAAAAAGVPLAIAETGVDKSFTGQARLDALTALARYAAAAGAIVACYFDQGPTDRWDILSDPASVAAWKAGFTG